MCVLLASTTWTAQAGDEVQEWSRQNEREVGDMTESRLRDRQCQARGLTFPNR